MTNEKLKFAERLNQALDYSGIPPKGKGRQIKVAEIFSVSQESVRKWLEGKSFPDTKRILKIAKKLNVDAQWLLTGLENINPSFITKELPHENSTLWIKVPILSWEEAGKWDILLPNIETNNRKWVWAATNISNQAYALIVNNDEMLPRYELNSILIIDPKYEPVHKHKVIYLMKGEKQVTCKQLIIDGKKKYLKPHNPLYPASILTQNDKYCGVIRQVIMNY